jgi:predicted nucleic acid-binding protein
VVVLDSSFLVAFHNQGDVHHGRACRGMDAPLAGEWGIGLLPEYVILEVVTVLALRKNLETAVRVGDLLLGARELEHVPCSDAFMAAFDTFRGQSHPGLSFVAAAVIAIACHRGVERVATFDESIRRCEGIVAVP